MSRYFNSIARQAGIRFADQEGRPDPRAAQLVKTAPDHEPLDKEEVVMVPPSTLTTGDKAASRGPETPAKAIDTEPVRKKRIKKLDGGAIPDTRSLVKEEVGQERHPGPSMTLQTHEETISGARRDDVVEKETIVGKDDGTKPQSKSLRKDGARTAAKDSDEVFFEQTLEIIGGRQAEPEEVRNIVIREVQEWVAAAPVEAEPNVDVAAGDNSRARREKMESAANRQQDEPVVLIADNSSKNQLRDETERQTVEEHFDLSIGTISVIIEGNEQPQVQNQSPPRPEQGRTKSTEQAASSRLDRSYL